MHLALLAAIVLGQGATTETAAERYFRRAVGYLDRKEVKEAVADTRARELPVIHQEQPVPQTDKPPEVPREIMMERHWQVGKKCGPVALFFLLRAMDVPVELDGVLSRVPVTDRGSSMAQLQEAAGQFGLKTEVIRYVPERFSDVPTPFIVHWKGPGGESGKDDHFDVVVRTDRDGSAVMVDTTNGLVTTLASSRVIGTRASGYALVVRGGSPRLTAFLRWVLGAVVVVNAVLGACLLGRRLGW
jgi:hypothetical protein